MKLPISKRLLCCAGMIPPGARVADIGTDHGYLPIFLARHGAAAVYAADLREKPLEKAMENARNFGVAQQIIFRRSDGLRQFDGTEIDTVVCAGMGGDLIIEILSKAPWLQNGAYTLILQPQSSGQDLRRWLDGHNFYIARETLVREGGFLYAVMRVHYGHPMHLTPGQQFLSPQLLQSGGPLLLAQMNRLVDSLRKTVAGIRQSRSETAAGKLAYYQAALQELEEMRNIYATGT